MCMLIDKLLVVCKIYKTTSWDLLEKKLAAKFLNNDQYSILFWFSACFYIYFTHDFYPCYTKFIHESVCLIYSRFLSCLFFSCTHVHSYFLSYVTHTVYKYTHTHTLNDMQASYWSINKLNILHSTFF